MKFLNNMKIGLRLNIILSLVMFIIISIFGWYMIERQYDKIMADTDMRMHEQVDGLHLIVDKKIGDTATYYNFLETAFNKKYFESGYPFLVHKDGTFIVHPSKKGQNFANAEFFKQIINSKTTEGKTFYKWEGRQKYQYFKYSKKRKAYISVSIYEDELLGMINEMRIAVIIAIVLGSLIFVLINTLLSRSITNALKKGVYMAESIAAGDLTKIIELNQKDEIGQLANALNRMAVKLSDIISGVVFSANSITSASQEMSSNSQQVSQGASEQASSAEEVSSSMEQMSSNIQQNTDNAQQTEKISSKAAEDIIEGRDNVNTAVISMKDIAEKVSIIGDIASQTNILALNAAVEAARAGEHGRGFAVVAAEVRKLAERSQKAAGEINEVSKTSVDVAEKSGNLLNAIVPDIQKTSKLVEEITAASLEQNSGAEQINNAITQLNQVTQQNAAAAEEMATSSEELSAQAEQLKDMVAFFKVDDKDSRRTNITKIKKESHYKKLVEKKPTSIAKSENKGFDLDMKSSSSIDNEYEEF